LGHSLGGALGLFMALYLYNVRPGPLIIDRLPVPSSPCPPIRTPYISIPQVHGVVPSLSLGLAGPFIGDQRFADVYYAPFRKATSDTWWQVETVDVNNRSNFDGTVESYQVSCTCVVREGSLAPEHERTVLVWPLPPPALHSSLMGLRRSHTCLTFHTSFIPLAGWRGLVQPAAAQHLLRGGLPLPHQATSIFAELRHARSQELPAIPPGHRLLGLGHACCACDTCSVCLREREV
jgi:hypothetical protein